MFPEIACDDVFRIETRRLWLRWPRMADAAAVARLAGEKQVAEMTARIPVPYSPEQAERTMLRMREANAEGSGLFLTIAPLARPNDVIGCVSVSSTADGDPVLGYWIGTPFWGKGFATEAAQALIDVTFRLSTARGIAAAVVPFNTGSRRVLENCGFAHVGQGMAEAPARGGPQAVDFFRLSRSTWERLKGWSEPRMEHRPAAPLCLEAAQ